MIKLPESFEFKLTTYNTSELPEVLRNETLMEEAYKDLNITAGDFSGNVGR